MIWGSINLTFLSDRPQSAPWIDLLHVAMEFVISFFFFFFFPHTQVLHSALSLKLGGFGFLHLPRQLLLASASNNLSTELQPQKKYTTYQTKGALFKSQSLLAASSSHTIIPRANYKSFALDTAGYLKCIKTAITMILVKWATARKGLCCRCNTFHRNCFI